MENIENSIKVKLFKFYSRGRPENRYESINYQLPLNKIKITLENIIIKSQQDKEVSARAICQECQSMAKLPGFQCGRCSYIVCETCVDFDKSRGTTLKWFKCPKCHHHMNDTNLVPKPVLIIIGNLQFKCNKPDCQTTSMFNYLEFIKHMGQSCVTIRKPCPVHCGITFNRKEMHQHLNKFMCDECGGKFTSCAQDNKH